MVLPVAAQRARLGGEINGSQAVTSTRKGDVGGVEVDQALVGAAVAVVTIVTGSKFMGLVQTIISVIGAVYISSILVTLETQLTGIMDRIGIVIVLSDISSGSGQNVQVR